MIIAQLFVILLALVALTWTADTTGWTVALAPFIAGYAVSLVMRR